MVSAMFSETAEYAPRSPVSRLHFDYEIRDARGVRSL
jgi:hypothetical protein